MIQAIIFDCFGVLARDGWLPFKEKYFARDRDKFTEATDSNKQVDAGLIGYDDFIQTVADLAGIPKAAAHQEIEQNPPNEELFAFVTELKSQYKIGLLSNAGANWLADMFTKPQLALFDAAVLSCEIGAIKPQPAAYHAIAERLGVAAEDCVFIDDQPRYCDGAESVGMTGIVYTDNAQCRRELTALLAAQTTD